MPSAPGEKNSVDQQRTKIQNITETFIAIWPCIANALTNWPSGWSPAPLNLWA